MARNFPKLIADHKTQTRKLRINTKYKTKQNINTYENNQLTKQKHRI